MNPLISIVIAVYNDAQYITQAVMSALGQTYAPIEIILVDDGSDEATKNMLKQIEPKVTLLLTQENQGQAKARNVGVSHAQGSYILIWDSDDYFEPTFCEKAMAVFRKNPDAKLVSCAAQLVYPDGKTAVYKPSGGPIDNFLFVNGAIGNSLFRKADFLAVGGYDETMRKGYEDWEFFIRLLKNGGQCIVLEEALFNYRKKTVSTTSKSNQYKYELLQYLYDKHQDLYVSHYGEVIEHLLNKCKKEEQKKNKTLQSIDYRLGNTIMQPLRFVRSLFH